jgi:hypothetical protein
VRRIRGIINSQSIFGFAMARLKPDNRSDDPQATPRTYSLLVFGFVAFAYWIGFYIFVFWDLYLSWPLAGLTVKALLPLVTLVNFVGLY